MNKLNIDNTKLYIYGKGATKSYEVALKQKYSNDKTIFQGFQKNGLKEALDQVTRINK